ncbi:MAG: ABC transporter permease [Candidatus Dormibacteraceae bacterium]
MSARVPELPAVSRREVAPVASVALAQIRAVLTGYRRNPFFVILSAVLPIFFFAIFGLTYGSQKLNANYTVSALIMGNMAAYAVSNLLVLNIGIGQATQRSQKLDLLQRATPLPPWIAVAANAVGGLLIAALAVIVLFIFGAIAGGVHLPLLTYLNLLWRVLLGALPMLGLGLAIGYGFSGNVAPAVANLIYLPMSFLSGIFVPLALYPKFIQNLAPILPTYHYAQLVQGAVGGAKEGLGPALLWLLGWGIVLMGLGTYLYRLDQRRKFS